MYEQGTDVRMLTSLLPGLASKVVIDAGAERGGFTQAFLDGGAATVFAIEPYPPNVAALRERFMAEPRVKVLPLALGERDETATLHLIEERDGANSSSYHSVARAMDTALLQTVGELAVACRSLDSLVVEGVLPPQVAILKIDAEGHDFASLRGMGSLTAAAVMVAFWDDLPEAVGRSQFALAEVDEFLRARGYAHSVVVKRHDELETVELNDVRTRAGDWGNAIFLHESAFPLIPAEVCAAAAAEHAKLIDKTLYYKAECGQRLRLIEEQAPVIQRQAAMIEEQGAEIALQTAAAAERAEIVDRQARSLEDHAKLVAKLRDLLKPVKIGERIRRVFRPMNPHDIP